jgi:hypothetical protein
MTDWSRRDTLRTAGALSTLSLTSLAGCTGTSLLGGGSGSSARKAMRTWTPARDEVPGTGPGSSGFSVSASAVDDIVDEDVDGYTDRVEEQVEPDIEFFDADPADVDVLVRVNYWSRVYRLDHDPDDAADALEDEGFEQDGEYGSFRRYVGDPSDRQRTSVTFDGSFVVLNPAENDSGLTAELLVDTYEGDVTAYADASDRFDEVLGLAPDDDQVYASVREDPLSAEDANPEYGQFEGLVGTGSAVGTKEDRIRQRAAFLFESADVVERDAVDAYVEEMESGDGPESLDASATIEGDVVRFELSAALDDVYTTTPTE